MPIRQGSWPAEPLVGRGLLPPAHASQAREARVVMEAAWMLPGAMSERAARRPEAR